VFASRKQTAALVVALAWLTPSQAEGVDFPLLPALKTELATESLLLEVARDGDRLLVGGEQGHILWSDDDGQSWTQGDVPISLAVTSVAFAGGGHAWATAHEGYLLHSADNGASWEVRLSGSDVARLSVGGLEQKIALLEEAVANATPETREDAEWALDDAHFTLDEARAAIDEGMTSPLLKVWFADENEGFVLGAYGTFLHTTDGGDTWASEGYRLDNPDNYHYYGIARSAAGTLLLAGEAGTLLRSLDNGVEWERIEISYPGSYFGAVAPSDGSLLIFGLRGNAFRSTDEGATWVPVDTGDQRTLMGGTAGDDGTVILTGSAGAVLRSADAGATFDVIPTTGNLVFSDVITAADGRTLLVGFGGISVLGEASDDE
jgi:photosystem II stability/assembly factor-like uncharacterized protein